MVLNEWKYFYLKNIPFLSWAVSGYWKGDWWGSFRAVNAAALRLRLEEEEDKKHQNLKWKMTCAIIPPKCAHFRAVNAAALRLELEEEKDKSPQTGLEMFFHTKSFLQNVQLFLQNVHIFELLTLQHWGSGSKKGKIKNKWEDVICNHSRRKR